MQNIGLLMTCNEVDVIEEVMQEHSKYFDTILVLDGSNDGTDEIIKSFNNVKFFMKDQDLPYSGRVKDGARGFLLKKAQELYGYDGWFTLLHGDEIFYDNPIEIAKLAERKGVDKVNWQPMNFFLHKTDKDRQVESIRSVQERLKWYSPASGLEIRQFKNKKGLYYDRNKHSQVMADGVGWKTLLYFPVYKHYPYRSSKQISKKINEGREKGFFSPTYEKIGALDTCFLNRLGKINCKFDGSFHEFEIKNQMKPWNFIKRVFLRQMVYGD